MATVGAGGFRGATVEGSVLSRSWYLRIGLGVYGVGFRDHYGHDVITAGTQSRPKRLIDNDQEDCCNNKVADRGRKIMI